MSVMFVGMPGVEDGLEMDAPVDEILAAAEQRLADITAGPEALVVIAPRTHARTSELARALGGHPGLALLRPTGPTTVLALLAHVLRAHPDLDPAEVLTVARQVPTHVHTHAIVSSVSKLSAPHPSLWQHLASWAPWTRFWVDVNGGTVAWTKVMPTTVPAVLQATLDPGTMPKLEVDSALPQGGRPVANLDTPSSNHWGSRGYLERSFLVTDPDDIRSMALAAPGRPCTNCTITVRGVRCDFCGVMAQDRRIAA